MVQRHIQIDVIHIVDYNKYYVRIIKSISENGENAEYLSIHEVSGAFYEHLLPGGINVLGSKET